MELTMKELLIFKGNSPRRAETSIVPVAVMGTFD
jgi:hypothetical protein